ncbi:MAG TPA: RHS repeat-associated core domain-containing protein, partial [Flavobacterium sp.]
MPKSCINYYPFGLKHNGYNFVVNGYNLNKYKYNGKELQDELGLNLYDYGARNYDPALGRW